MKIITFQNKAVLDEILEKGVYLAKTSSMFRDIAPVSYDTVFKSIPNKEEGATQPIFGWYSISGCRNEDLELNSATIDECQNLTSSNEYDDYIFVLEIPDDRVSLQGFFTFSDVLFEEHRTNSDSYEIEESALEEIFDIYGSEDIQCTFSSIRKEYIVSVKSFAFESDEWHVASVNIERG